MSRDGSPKIAEIAGGGAVLLLPHKVRKDCASCARVLAPCPLAPRRDQAAVLEKAYIKQKYGLEKETRRRQAAVLEGA